MLKLISLFIEGCVKFNLSNIRSINIDFDQAIHILIGRNGCGKSSLLHMLLPDAPVKTFFKKDGVIRATFRDDINTYVLAYSPSTGHIFKLNGINLNESGIRDIQIELIDKHFGLNNSVRSILRNDLDLVDMRPSQRKSTLLDLNPIDITIYGTELKRVTKISNAYNDQLKLLYNREQRNTIELLDDDQLQEYLNKSRQLKDEESKIVLERAKNKDKLDNLEELEEVHIDHFDDLIDNMLVRSRDVVEGDVYVELNQLPLVIENFESKVNQIDTKLTDLAEDTLAIEDRIGQLDEANDNNLDDTIITLEEEMSKMEITKRPIHENDMEEFSASIDKIKELCSDLSEIDYTTILTQAEANDLRDTNENVNISINNLLSKRSNIDRELTELTNKKTNPKIPTLCGKNECDLYIDHTENTKYLDSQIKSLNEELVTIDKLSNDLIATRNKTNEQLYYQDKCHVIVGEIVEVINSTPYMSSIIVIKDIVQYLNTTLSKVPDILTSSYFLSKTTHLYEKKAIDLKKYKNDLKLKRSNEDINRSYLIKDLRRIYKERDDLHTKREVYINKINSRINKLSNCKLKVADFHLLEKMEVELDKYEKYSLNLLEKELLVELIGLADHYLNETRGRLAECSKVIERQNNIKYILNNEIRPVIEELRPKFETAKEIVIAIKELQSLHTRTFLNNIIDRANTYLDEILTYDFAIDRVVGNNIDYKLPVLMDSDVPVADISMCSSAQCSMGKLALNLALIYEMELTHLPISLDEIDKDLDEVHRLRVFEMLNQMIDDNELSQLFVANHHPELNTCFICDISVLDGRNITLPEQYNTRTTVTTE